MDNPEIVFKRKYRWTFEAKFKDVYLGQHFVSIAARPDNIGETQEPKQLITTCYDVGRSEEIAKLYELIALYYDFSNDGVPKIADTPGGVGTLILYDGCGCALEKWTLLNLWSQSINFGDLDYSSSDVFNNIDVTWRFSEIEYTNLTRGTSKDQSNSEKTMGLVEAHWYLEKEKR